MWLNSPQLETWRDSNGRIHRETMSNINSELLNKAAELFNGDQILMYQGERVNVLKKTYKKVHVIENDVRLCVVIKYDEYQNSNGEILRKDITKILLGAYTKDGRTRIEKVVMPDVV